MGEEVLAGPVLPRSMIWANRGPDAWPPRPSRMSFSTLRSIEVCPLRWSLQRGSYRDVWAGAGYPPAPATATVAGHLIHVALERIVQALTTESVEAGRFIDEAVDTFPMARVVSVLRGMGGISAVLEDALRETAQSWDGNPRLEVRGKDLAAELQRQIPILRPRVQQFLQSIDVARVEPVSPRSKDVVRERRTPAIRDVEAVPHRRALAPGLHAEAVLLNDELGWVGKADLLNITDGSDATISEIVDFKTGSPKPDHALQLRIYALLWARDRHLNPAGNKVQRLSLVYGATRVNVPPPLANEELDELAADVMRRTSDALAAIDQRPPIPTPSVEGCQFCEVRQMCPAYWAEATRALLPAAAERPHLGADVEVQLLSKQGPWSWVGRVTATGAMSVPVEVGVRLLIRAQPNDMFFGNRLTPGSCRRILRAQLLPSTEESGGLPVLSLTRSTEAFDVPSTPPP